MRRKPNEDNGDKGNRGTVTRSRVMAEGAIHGSNV